MRNWLHKPKTHLATVALLAAAPAWAGHPFITDDSGTLGQGRWQGELNTDQAVERGTDLTGQAVNGALTYGWAENIDLSANLLWQRYEAEGGSDVDGVADTTLAAKWRFHESGALSAALKPMISLPTGDSDQGLGTGRTGTGVTGIVTWEGEGLTLAGNLGYTWNDNDAAERSDIWSLSGAAFLAWSERVTVGLELGTYTNGDPSDDTAPAFANVGVVYSPTEILDLDAGYLVGLNDAESLRSLGVGMTLHW